MPTPEIPLAEVFVAANSLRSAGLITEYALGAARPAGRDTEPVTTYDADIFFIPVDRGLTAGSPAISAHLQSLGHSIDREHVLVRGFSVQWLAADALTEEAVRDALPIVFDDVPGRTFRIEHLIAIATKVGRKKDHVRIEQLLQQSELDRPLLDEVLSRYRLKLPTS